MIILHYNEQQLAEKLERLPAPYRAVFAAACAERLLPAYASFSRRAGRGDPVKLRTMLERLWRDLDGEEKMTDVEISENLQFCMNLIPQEGDEPWVPEQAAAEDAASSLAYAIRCRQTGDAQEAAWAARRAYEALDRFVIDHEGIDTNVSHGERRVLSHPLVQSELARQRQDMEELLDAAAANLPNRTRLIRQRAKDESQMFFSIRS